VGLAMLFNAPLSSRGVWHSGHLASSSTRYFPRLRIARGRRTPRRGSILGNISGNEKRRRQHGGAQNNCPQHRYLSPAPLAAASVHTKIG